MQKSEKGRDFDLKSTKRTMNEQTLNGLQLKFQHHHLLIV